MEFSLGRDALPSQARSVRGESRRLRRERDNAKKLLSGCTFWRIAQRDCAVAILRPVFSANWRTAADVKSVHDHLSRHHAGPKTGTGMFRYRPRHGPYRPVRARPAKRAIAAVSLRLRLPPRAAAGRTGTDHFHGRARSCLTGDSPQPQPRRHHSNQFITEKNMCDDVSANKSLNGNERETPSIRSRLVGLVGYSL
jgi:hypothetical protein